MNPVRYRPGVRGFGKSYFFPKRVTAFVSVYSRKSGHSVQKVELCLDTWPSRAQQLQGYVRYYDVIGPHGSGHGETLDEFNLTREAAIKEMGLYRTKRW